MYEVKVNRDAQTKNAPRIKSKGKLLNGVRLKFLIFLPNLRICARVSAMKNLRDRKSATKQTEVMVSTVST